ncbi:MAG: homocysteine S-methyltransferase family protein [Clostridiales bacterium]|nr:homocysteine S-methyltransferase family protein [Clostridiales bacterium]
MDLKNDFLLFDGGFGTMLQQRGLKTGEQPDMLNLTNPDLVRQIHKEYVDAGADIITANTFSSNRNKLPENVTVDEVVGAAIRLAKEAGAKKVALDVSQIGILMEPVGEMTFDEAYGYFKQTVIAGAEHGADLILIETMSDMLETKAALLAAKENTDLPVFVSMTLGEDGRTFLGTDAKTIALTFSALGADALGLNCSLGPVEMLPLIKEICEYSTVPVLCQPNAGIPVYKDGKTVYTVSVDEFVSAVSKMLDYGVTVIGGCCGTTPEYTAALRKLISGRKPVKREIKRVTAITSSSQSVILDGRNIAVIGERINPTGKKRLRQALVEKDYEYILGEAITQTENGADLLDVNAGLPEINEEETLEELIRQIQAVTALPLQIDSSSPEALERACRHYCGKPIINSVNGKKESLETILPIAKKYGAAVVGLTLDENGIPDTAEERFEIAEKILETALSYGIPKEDVLIDSLVLTASTNQKAVMETLETIKKVKNRLGLKTVLGVSNVSFGLPNRELVNSTFLAAAFGAGLDMPILNPLSQKYTDVVNVFKVLNAQDENSEKYIEKYASLGTTDSGPNVKKESVNAENSIENVILSGRKSEAASLTKEMLKTLSPVEIIDKYFIPSLDKVGEKYEKGEFFLPQLMSSAETVKAGFDVLKRECPASETGGKGEILVATVKGDIHDIGKNIVKMLLENYGFKVLDLGKDVEPEDIVKAVKEHDIKLVGLSALMTTTVRNMEKTINALKKEVPDCKVMVGGAVLNSEYASQVGADFYSKDAAGSARIAEEYFGKLKLEDK